MSKSAVWNWKTKHSETEESSTASFNGCTVRIDYLKSEEIAAVLEFNNNIISGGMDFVERLRDLKDVLNSIDF